MPSRFHALYTILGKPSYTLMMRARASRPSCFMYRDSCASCVTILLRNSISEIYDDNVRSRPNYFFLVLE